MRAGHGEVEMVGEDGSEMGLVMKKKGKQKSTTGIGASLTLDYRDKEESNNNNNNSNECCVQCNLFRGNTFKTKNIF